MRRTITRILLVSAAVTLLRGEIVCAAEGPGDHKENYRVEATFGLDLLRAVLRDKDTVIVPHDKLGMDGFEVCEQIYKNQISELPVIILTGEEVNTKSFKKYPFVKKCIFKPFDYVELLHEVKKIIHA